jgi:hypothetical protein
MVGVGVNDVPIVGEPVAFGAGFIAFLFVCFSTVIGSYFGTYAHEGGHMLAVVASTRRLTGFRINPQLIGDRGVTDHEGPPGAAVRRFFITLSGYLAPPLLGLAGAALIAAGNPWAVLVAAIVFSLLALLVARTPLAFTIPFLIVIGLGAALLTGTGPTQAFAAVAVTWFLLINGTVEAFRLPSSGGDAASLAGRTLIPGFIWKTLWIFVAVVALIVGGQLLLRPGYGIG